MAVHPTGFAPRFCRGFRFRIVGAGIVASILLLAYSFPASSSTTSGTVSGHQEKGAVEPLVPGKPSERELAGGASHSYSIALETGQYLQVMVDQRGIDVILTLVAPDGKKIIEVDSPLGTSVPEVLFVIAEASGNYRLDVRSADNNAPPGRYLAGIEKLGAPNADDLTKAQAQLRFAQAETLRAQGTADAWRGAIAKYEESLALWRKVGDQLWQAYNLTWSGLLYFYLGEFQKSLENSNTALELYRKGGQHLGESTALNNIGLAYDTLGERRKALEYYNHALPIAQDAGNHELQGLILNNMGIIYDSLGEPQKALELYARALPLHRAANYRFGEAYVLTNMGAIYSRLGDQQRALEYYNQALPISRSAKDVRTEGFTQSRIAIAYDELRDDKKALECYTRAAKLQNDAGDRVAEGLTLMRLGTLHERLGDSLKALDYYDRALGQLHAAGNRRGEAVLLSSIGHVNDSKGDKQKALDYYRQALSLSEAVGDQAEQVRTLRRMTAAYDSLGDLARARASIETALTIIETTRTHIAAEGLRESYFAVVHDAYFSYADVLMKLHRAAPAQGHDALAFEASERDRARTLLDLLSESRAEIREGVDPALLARETDLRQRLNTVAAAQTNMLSRKHTEAAAASISRELQSVRTQYEDVEAEIRARSPRYAALTQPVQLGLADVRKEVLDPNTLLLEYMLGPDHSYLWVVGVASIAGFRLPARVEIEAAARRVYDLLALYQPVEHETLAEQRARQARADRDYPAAARSLSQMVLGPASSTFGEKRLLVVADGALAYVPFAALPIPQANGAVAALASDLNADSSAFIPLVTQHEIASAPSASALAVLRRETAARNTASKAVAVFADPVFDAGDPRLKQTSSRRQARVRQVSVDSESVPRPQADPLARALRDLSGSGARGALTRLPFTRQEAQAITSLVPREQSLQALDFRASREVASRADMSSYRIVHFATHGLLDDQHPELSGLVLSLVDESGNSKDGFLRLNEIYNLRLTADLVVLSACQTGLGKEVRGEGLIGLTRGFMYAGARSVAASLWKVDDVATRELMKRFYTKMFKSGLRPAASLRAAQLEMLKTQQWQAPYYWAGFVLQGEWE